MHAGRQAGDRQIGGENDSVARRALGRDQNMESVPLNLGTPPNSISYPLLLLMLLL